MRLWRAASALLDVRLEPDRPLAEDAQRNVYIPPRGELERTLRVGAVYNDEAIQIRYEFATEAPSWYHQYWVYEVEGRGSDGEWVRYGSGGPEPDEHGLYEDRISMLLDDGDVGLDRYGGFMTAHEGMRGLTGAAGADEVRAHPHLGETLGRSDVRKYIPQSREDGDGAADWAAVRDEAELEAMRERGEFLDLWQWRAHRSHPLGYADNGYVLEYRHSSAGRGMFTDNWDDEAEQPRWMYDPDEAGFRALDRERLFAGDYDQDDLYYLSEGHATDFDPDHPWEDGDVLPQRFLQEPDGSRGAIRADGGYEDGAWRVRLTRSLEAPDPTDSHALEPGEVYDVAFAVHEGVGQRWHRVSMPHTLALAGEAGDAPEADIVATYTEGDLDEAEVAWADIGLIYPGQMTWDWLIDRGRGGHPGAGHVLGGEDAIGDEHRLPQLEDYLLYEERRRIERSE
ncbi:ethylbenzene dehydrogenase-related protein [Halorhodospira halophila]|uniref:ethylbenzene dehydrogenase-related protein n=1 Tax=Halorhodospira halophila TaxID=1053 RepID=UPI003D36374A